MNDVVGIANSNIVWVVSSVAVLAVVIQALVFIRLAYKNASHLGVSKGDCDKALRVGAISSIGPAIAVFVALIGLMTTIGGPIAWSRLAMVGSAPTELAVVGAVTSSMGVAGAKLGDLAYTEQVLAVTWWTLALNGIGWLIFCACFAHKMESIRERLGGGDIAWLSLLSSAAMLGIFGYLTLNAVFGARSVNTSALVAAVAGAAAMTGCIQVAKKLPVIREYSLGIAILFGIALAMIL